jgi:hypothetical protein
VEKQEQSDKNNNPSSFWNRPWKFSESFMISVTILLAGLVIEAITNGSAIKPIGVPYNIYIAFAFVSVLIFLHFGYRDSSFVKWISSVPAAISAISMFALLVLLLGFIPQDNTKVSEYIRLTGLSHIKTSWTFALLHVYVLTSLGMVTLRRIVPFNKKNIGFFLNHFGLWLILLTAGLGAGDLRRLTINLLKNEKENNIGISAEGDIYKLPFTLKLLDFTIDEYASKLAIVDVQTGNFIMEKGKELPVINNDLKTKIGDWLIVVLKYLPNATLKDSTVKNSKEQGSCPAAKVIAYNVKTKVKTQGWVSTGSYSQNPIFMRLATRYALLLTEPTPKRFSSRLEVITDSIHRDTVKLEVNKPLTLRGWKIYQVSYDQSKGKWSSLSVIEAVSDPWLPVIYTGVFLLMAGAVYLFWKGK